MRYLSRLVALAAVAVSVLVARSSPASNFSPVEPSRTQSATHGVALPEGPVAVSAVPAVPVSAPEPSGSDPTSTTSSTAVSTTTEAPVAPSVPSVPASAGQVLVIGDSLTVGAQASLTSSSSRELVVDAEVGRNVRTGIAKLRTRNAPDYSTIVFALGTNDYLASASQVSAWVDQVVEASGGQTVIWVNLDAGGSMPGAASFNAALTSAAAAHPNVIVADWNSHIASIGGLRAADGIHYTPSGYQARGVWLADLVG